MRRALILVLVAAFVLPSGPGDVLEMPRSTAVAGGRPLRFLLDTPLQEGGRTRVRLRNTSDRTFIYNPHYEACKMVFKEAPGREFIIPEGTHCDLIVRERVSPGETVTLFRWNLDECVEDNWGCRRARDLPADRYVMKGHFRPRGGGDFVRVRRYFRIRNR